METILEIGIFCCLSVLPCLVIIGRYQKTIKSMESVIENQNDKLLKYETKFIK